MKITYLDLETNNTAINNDISVFELTEGNWSCDCNRRLVFFPSDIEIDCKCISNRFIVIDVVEEVDEEFECHGYTKEEILKESNSEYYNEKL